MPRLSYLLAAVFGIFAMGPAFADEAADEAKIMAQPETPAGDDAPSAKADEESKPAELSVGTKLYDAATVEDLFETYDKQNKRVAAENEHLNADALNVIELSPVEVRANDLRNMRELAEKIDPQPRRRLQRLAELDPEAAADLQVSMRSEERFFAGEMDATNDMNSGRTANVDFRKIGTSLDAAVERVKKALTGKKVTDDQAEVVAGEE